jgi:hypothetical protein
MKWPFTFYKDSLVSEGAAGCARGFLIFIREKYKDDEGLYAHEFNHVKQYLAFALLGLAIFAIQFQNQIDPNLNYVAMVVASLHPLLYKFVPSYRLWAEVQCYKIQNSYCETDRSELFAKFIAESYDLDITQAEALRKMRE